MSKEIVKISDFLTVCDIVKSLTRMSDGVKFSINDCGLTVYAKNDFSKCELTSNALVSDTPVDFCIGDLAMFMKILTTVKDLYGSEGYAGVKLSYDRPFVRIESKKFKTKLATVEEERIQNFIGTKVKHELSPQLELTTSSDKIRSINSHSFIFSDTSSARIYLVTEGDMQNNTVFARIGNESNDLANSVTLELGMLNSGTLGDRKVILDFGRLNILNMVPSDEIRVELAKEFPVLVSRVRKTGQNGTFFNVNIYSFMMVK